MHPLIALVLVGAVAAFGALRVFGGQAGGKVAQCASAATARSSFATLESAAATSGLRSLPIGGTSDDEGLQEPSTAWTDIHPIEPRQLTSTTAVDDGFEIRWWSPALDHQAADLFVFKRAEAARQYLDVAVSAACRAHAIAYRLAQPSGALALIWTNPDEAHEADVFFVRGTHAHRIVEVPPTTYESGPLKLDDRELVGLAQLVACEVKQAGCDRPQLRPALTIDGYVALETLGRAIGLVGVEPLVEAPEIISRACLAMRPLHGLQARTLYEACQVAVHLYDVYSYELGCHGARACEQWTSNAAAGDMRRTAAIMRQIASQLIPGDCRIAWSRDATRDDRLGEVFELYGRSALASNRSARRRVETEAERLIGQAERIAVPVPEVLDACAPHGQALGLPELA